MKQLKHCAAALVLAAVASTAGAQAPPAAKQAYQRGDYATVIRTLLPGYRDGSLGDGESLRLLAYSCVNRGSGGLLGGLLGGRGKGGDNCHADSGPIMQAAAQAGDQEAMLSLVLAQGPHNAPVAMPGLPQDLSASHYWAVMASLLASTPRQAEDAQVQLRGHERFIPAAVREDARRRAEEEHPALLARVRATQPELPDRMAAGKGGGGTLPWLEGGALRQAHRFPLPDERAGIDPASIVRNGDGIQFVSNESDDMDAYAVLLQGRCSDGRPGFAWGAEHSGQPGLWVLAEDGPQRDLGVERGRYTAMVRQACAIKR